MGKRRLPLRVAPSWAGLTPSDWASHAEYARWVRFRIGQTPLSHCSGCGSVFPDHDCHAAVFCSLCGSAAGCACYVSGVD